MIQNLDDLAKFVKGGADVLQNAIKSDEEVSLEFIEGSFVSDTDLNLMKETRFTDGKKEGNKIGYDHGIKDFKKEFGLEIEGKDRKVIADAIRNQIITDAKIEPDKKVNELNTSLANLQSQYETDLGVKTNEVESLSNKLREYKVNGDLAKHLPEGLTGIDANDFMTLAKTSASFEYDDDVLVVKKNGAIQRDKMEKPITPKDYLTSFATNKKWMGTEGREGGDQNGNGSGTFKNMNEVYKHMETNNINPTSPAGQKLVTDFNNNN